MTRALWKFPRYMVVLVAFVAAALPLLVHAETIDSFEAEITVAADGSFTVVETIEYTFDEERHGIFREIPLSHPQESGTWYKERYVEIAVTAVTMDGSAVPYEITRSGGMISLRIGDPNSTISGTHVYSITYQVSGALTYYDSGAIDLYWNVTGNDWEVPIASATASVTGEGLRAPRADCYVGVYGDTGNCTIATTTNATIFSATQLAPGEGLTIAQSLNADAVARQVFEQISLVWFWLAAAIAWFVGLVWYVARYLTQHRTGRTVIAQYEPYEQFKPMYTGLLFDGRIDSRDITAGIVSLAEQGFISITRTDRKVFLFFETDDYEIMLRRLHHEATSQFERRILTLLFAEDTAIGSTMSLGDLKTDTSQQMANRLVLHELHTAASEDLIVQGFFEHRYKQILTILGGLTLGIALLLIGTYVVGADIGPAIAIALFTLIGSGIALAFTYRRRTRKGYEALDHLKGFKRFLSVTDKERFTFHNAPQKSPEQFMAFLPYAIAFGVEKEWATVFKDVTIPEPAWYSSGGHGAFSAIHLTNSLSAFGTTFTSASGTSSASSGGGSSGGGAGGGGGGSW